MGGFDHVNLAGKYGERDSYEIAGGSVNSDGSATNVQASAVAAEKSSGRAESDAGRNLRGLRNGELSLGWNSAPMLDKVSVNESRDPAVMAKHVNRSLRGTAIKPIWEHNMTNSMEEWMSMARPPAASAFLAAASAYLSYNYTQDLINISGDPALGIFSVGMNWLIAATFGSIVFGRGSRDALSDPAIHPWLQMGSRERGRSGHVLMPSIRPTRTAVASAGITAGRIVRATPAG